MSDFKYAPKYGIIILCTDEEEQKKIYEMLIAQGLKLKVVNV